MSPVSLRSEAGRRPTLATHALRGDSVLVCMDAFTGKSLWKTTFPNAGFNRMSHKTGPTNCTPCISGDRIFIMDIGGRMHAVDVKTGQELWAVQLAPAAGYCATTMFML